MTSLVMEIATGGMKWWDYSGYFLNLNGRICAEGLLVFGVGGLAIVYVIAPVIDGLIGELNEKQIMAVCSALIILFAADAVYSQFQPNTGKGITDIESGKENKNEVGSNISGDRISYRQAAALLRKESGQELWGMRSRRRPTEILKKTSKVPPKRWKKHFTAPGVRRRLF